MPDAVKIFVVDDDPGMRDSLRFLFEAEELPAEFFASARAFLASGHADRPGCLIADVAMPDMNGLELQQELAQRKSPLAVIFITGHADVPMAVHAMRAGASDFIEKPFSDETLLDSVRRALGQIGARPHPLSVGATGIDPGPIAQRLSRLTPRERDVLEYLVRGDQHKAIAHALGISPRTVEVHRARIMQKLEARNLAQLVEMMLTIRGGQAGNRSV